MEYFGIIDTLKDYCDEKGYYFIHGIEKYQNAVADENVYADNEMIMIAFFKAQPKLSYNKCIGMIYNGSIGLGRKRESVTVNEGTEEEPINVTTYTQSSLDETFQQKYDLRLKELSQMLMTIIETIGCENELEFTSVNFDMVINKFDLNADFVEATVTIEQ